MAIQKRMYVDFLAMPEPEVHKKLLATETCIAATGDTVLNQWTFPNGVQFTHRQEGACADIVPSKALGTGLTLPCDATQDEGGELVVAGTTITSAATGPVFVVGTDAAFRIDVKFKIPVVLDHSVLGCGFRRQYATSDPADDFADAWNTAAECITLYDDIAMLNCDDGDIHTCTRLNAGTGTATDTTDNWAINETKTFSVLVSSAGVATFLIDGVAPTVNTNTLTFDTGDVLIPFFYYCKDANGTDTPPILVSWFSGHQ